MHRWERHRAKVSVSVLVQEQPPIKGLSVKTRPRLLALLLPAMLRLLSLLLGLSPAPGRWPSVAGVQDSGMQLDFPTG